MLPQWFTLFSSAQELQEEPFNAEYQEDAEWIQVLPPNGVKSKPRLSRQERRANARLASKEKKRQARALRRGII
jgi:hypothetical protein